RLPRLPGGAVPLVKRYFPFKNLPACNQAHLEWERITKFDKAGFSGPSCVAMGFGDNPKEKALLLFLEESQTLSFADYLRQISFCPGKELVLQVAESLGHMHRSGFRIPELRSNLIMVRSDRSFYFCDLSRLQSIRPDTRAVNRDLACLSATLDSCAGSRTLRLRFLLRYLEAAEGYRGRGSLRKRVSVIARFETKLRKKKLFPDFFPVRRLEDANGRLLLHERFAEMARDLGWETVSDFVQPQASAELLRDLGIRKNYRIRYGKNSYYLKVHRERSPGKTDSKGRREWENHLRLLRIGLNTPVPVACGETGEFSFFLSQGLEGPTGEEIAPIWSSQPFTLRNRLIGNLALAVSRMHRNGLFHRDLYLCHTIAMGEKVHFIDLQRLEERPFFQRHRRIKDLAALLFSSLNTEISRADRLRFYLHYSGGGRLDRKRKRMIRLIGKKARKIARQVCKKEMNR
ncbi:MAG: hypothetical protein KJ645_11620, partial [Planctomycetes bacterium]|nr:hypothetical protein [Planctomycetota bacterium]